MKRHGIIVRPDGAFGATFNPAVAKIAPGQYVLLVRSALKGYTKPDAVNHFDDSYTSHLSLWEGSACDSFSMKDPEALKPDRPFDIFGVEDPRITLIGDTYYICYTSLAFGLGRPEARDGIRIALASTKDFKTFTKHGVIGPDNQSKAGALFECGGKLYFLWKNENEIERTMISTTPENFTDPTAWRDFWADPAVERHLLLGPHDNGHEGFGVEPGPPPIEIDAGLLMVYSSISRDFKWTISVLLLDKTDPRRIIAKSEKPILEPEADYELYGDVHNVVFPCGALIEDGRLYIYYGGADTVCALASESMENVMQLLKPYDAAV